MPRTHDQPYRTLARELTALWLRRHRRVLLGLLIATIVTCAIALRGESSRAVGALAAIGFYGPMAIGLLTMSGIVSDELRSGVTMLWLPKPGSLVVTYLSRYAIYQALLVLLVLVLATTVGSVAVASGAMTAVKAVRFGLATTHVGLIAGSMVFAFSAFNVRRDSTVAAIAIIGSTAISSAFAFDYGWMAQAVRAIAFPLDALGAISGGSAYPPGITSPLMIVWAQIIGWTAIGLLGLGRLEQRIASQSLEAD